MEDFLDDSLMSEVMGRASGLILQSERSTSHDLQSVDGVKSHLPVIVCFWAKSLFGLLLEFNGHARSSSLLGVRRMVFGARMLANRSSTG